MKKINIYRNGQLFDFLYGEEDDAVKMIKHYQRSDFVNEEEYEYTWEFVD